jgi:hypothetical protein
VPGDHGAHGTFDDRAERSSALLTVRLAAGNALGALGRVARRSA